MSTTAVDFGSIVSLPGDFALEQAVERRRYIWTNSAWKASAAVARAPAICLNTRVLLSA
jgi:hypothetical protein